ncbi:MAG: Uma2 family endonuclease [Pirellulales bacterium]|nr:Uma2 family endonuclease [Pirellulales bacterium]
MATAEIPLPLSTLDPLPAAPTGSGIPPSGTWDFGEITLSLAPLFSCNEEQFCDLAAQNPELRLELSPTGTLIIMAPSFSLTGSYNADALTQLMAWARQFGGKVFDSSAGFRLPLGGVRAPDASWIAQEQWDQLSPEKREKYAHICPDFVLELRSPTDRLATLQAKMVEYLANGARLGWLVDPVEKKVHVYFPGKEPEILQNPATVSGDPVLPGFVLALATIFTDQT